MSVPDRQDIIRVDCPTCSGNGYITKDGQQTHCRACGGVGMREKSMPYRPEGYTTEEAGEILGVRNATNKLLPGDPANSRGKSTPEEE